MDIVTIVTVFVFVAILQLSSRFKFHPILSSVLVVLTPFLLALLLKAIVSSGNGYSTQNLLPWRDIIVVTLQLPLSVLFFYKIRNEEDSLSAWFGWSLVGLIVIFIAIPAIFKFI